MKELEPLSPHFGAIVHGVDLADVDDDTLAGIRTSLVDHKVLFFRRRVMHRITLRGAVPVGPR